MKCIMISFDQASHDAVIEALAEANKNLVVVLLDIRQGVNEHLRHILI